jgi:phosphoribosylformimino-5-aminoimidazole carboxamide ribotide isomerase
MILIPAIDIKDGHCVRLAQGEMDQVTVYSQNPVEIAQHWQKEGAKRLHLVDLNGAVTGQSIHFGLIKEIIQAISIPVEVGGGIRSLRQVEDYLATGAAWVILGTSILSDESLVYEAAKKFPKQIIAGIDCKQGRVATRGWVQLSDIHPIDLAKKMQDVGFSAVILTDIEKDGMLSGPNFDLYKEMGEAMTIPIIASGGITTLTDISRLNKIKGVSGAIIGKALYSGALSYRDARSMLDKEASHAD